ncbi:hypothetical protein [Enterococcus sp. BWR-S5]|uniref:hypothetical protein n=1 Tax=Enterococcus sp. BWR-S5 TaxID=2787714 RepID=UPI0019225F26|nr:hypothetical protein [Enterococcus sp. BWR-S5]MBL1227264.1 hypothetical protein [Enterococcus sp. BWR-S5]
MKTIIYKQESNVEALLDIVNRRKHSNFLHIGKSVESANNNDQMHIIELISINKTDYCESITPLAYFVGEENQFTIAEEEQLIKHLNEVLYSILKK